MSSNNGRVLIVGLCCLDLVNYVDQFPAEDSDTRVFEQRTCLGGNATNSTVVFNQIGKITGAECELFAALPEGNLLLESLIQQTSINCGQSPRRPNAECPISTVIVNRQTGTRTILHYRGNFPELTVHEFRTLISPKLENFEWIHFEGRNFDQIRLMMEFVNEWRYQNSDKIWNLWISVELEKLRPFPSLEQLIPLADLIFVSKDFAQSHGWHSMESAIDGIQKGFGASETKVICQWGEMGAAGRENVNSPLILQPTFPLPGPIVDTLGAGDTFIGCALVHLANGKPLAEVMAKAVRVAGIKCTRKGLLRLEDLAQCNSRCFQMYPCM